MHYIGWQIVSVVGLARDVQGNWCRKGADQSGAKKEQKIKRYWLWQLNLWLRVLIEPAAAEEKTIGGIIIPDTAKEKPLQGKVVATGNGTKDEEMVVKEGDTVLYGKYAGTELEYDGKKYLVMRQSDILAILG